MPYTSAHCTLPTAGPSICWETEQGRWALRLVDMLRGGINQPALSALLMLFLYALAGVLLTDLFGVRSRAANI